MGAKSDSYISHSCWIGGGHHAPAIPVKREKVTLDGKEDTFYVKDLFSWGEGGGIYVISIDNPIDHYGVIDFAGVRNVTLFFDDIHIKKGDWLVIKNLGTNRIAGNNGGGSNWHTNTRNIAMEVDGKLMSISHYWPGKHWWCEHTGYNVIVATKDEWVPLPEPSTYGAALAAVGLGAVLFRRGERAGTGARDDTAC